MGSAPRPQRFRGFSAPFPLCWGVGLLSLHHVQPAAGGAWNAPPSSGKSPKDGRLVTEAPERCCVSISSPPRREQAPSPKKIPRYK
eukprot:4532544-Amphidinium_carterae.1